MGNDTFIQNKLSFCCPSSQQTVKILRGKISGYASRGQAVLTSVKMANSGFLPHLILTGSDLVICHLGRRKRAEDHQLLPLMKCKNCFVGNIHYLVIIGDLEVVRCFCPIMVLIQSLYIALLP
ncbi:MAG: hypothetical protein ACJA13_000460 [Paraglaciecola sp.]